MDPLTLTVEILGIIILLIWLVIPVQEFKHILTELRKQGRLGKDGSSDSQEPRR